MKLCRIYVEMDSEAFSHLPECELGRILIQAGHDLAKAKEIGEHDFVSCHSLLFDKDGKPVGELEVKAQK